MYEILIELAALHR